MKKVFSIFFALQILLSGMHPTIATHFCHNRLVASRISFTGKQAFCGMEEQMDSHSADGLSINRACCSDHISSYEVSHFYSLSFFNFKASLHPLFKVCITPDIPDHYLAGLHVLSESAKLHPPGYFYPSDVSLPGICILRI